MSNEIEADYKDDYHNEDKHCRLCDSYRAEDGVPYCVELEQEISPTGNCDFFKAID